jgi:hypothetical protein
VLAFRHSDARAGQRRWPAAELEPLVVDQNDLDDRAVERMSNAAAADDGYRVQLIDLAALHGELYLRAVKTLFRIEVRLGHWEAEARRLLDLQQLDETRKRDAQT